MTEAPKGIRLICEDNGETVAERLEVARGSLARMRGLIGRREFPPGSGLLIPDCRCIHTCFMAFPIDVLFITARNELVKKVDVLKPWRIAGAIRARHVVELPVGTLARFNCPIGARFKLEDG